MTASVWTQKRRLACYDTRPEDSFQFAAHFSRDVVARFDGGTKSSDGGALLLRQTGRRLNLLGCLAACIDDQRSPWLISHSVRELVSQRV
jgi:hypothetical protein